MSEERITFAERANKLLEVLGGLSDRWVSRTELARHLGKSRLTPDQISSLDMLIEQGKVEIRKQEISGFIGFQWTYRIKTPEPVKTH